MKKYFSALAFFLLTIAAAPLSTNISVQQKTEASNQQASMLFVGPRLSMNLTRQSVFESFFIELNKVGLSSTPFVIGNNQPPKKPLMPVLTHRPFT